MAVARDHQFSNLNSIGSLNLAHTMQRMLLSSSRLSCRVLATARTQRQITRTIAGQERGKTPTAAEIKKNVPELWVRKAKTFFAYFDSNGDGVMNVEDYRLCEKYIVESALANNASDDRIQEYKAGAYKLWIEEIGGGEEDFQWTENKFLEIMFEAVSRPGSEEYFRRSASKMFDLVDLNKDGSISKDEYSIMLGGSPWTIVAFSSVDTNRNGEVSREEFVHGYVDYWFNFADETHPSKHFLGVLVNM